MFRCFLLAGILLLFLSQPLFSQSKENIADKDLVLTKITGLKELYDSLFQQNLQLVDGKAHTAVYPAGIGHPFFQTGEPVGGTIYMNGKEFNHSFIRYDLLNDILQIYHFTKSGPQIIDLNKDKIEAFTIDGHHFIHLQVSVIPGISSLEGFYEEKYKGMSSFLVRHEKVYLENISGSRGGYEEHIYRYIINPDGLFKVTGRKSLLKAFQKYQEEIKGYIRKTNLTVKLATDEEIIRLIKFIESISGSF